MDAERIEALLHDWERLDSAISRAQCSLPHQLSNAFDILAAERTRFRLTMQRTTVELLAQVKNEGDA